MKNRITSILLLLTLLAGCGQNSDVVTTESLLNEMVGLERLTTLPEYTYKTIQFSSYDRRSTSPTDSGWFSNEDGFGDEPIPGFEKVLVEPDSTGTGEYLICDVRKPGAILRLWTAGINGKIRLFLDDMKTPVFEGDAQTFFWNTIGALSENEIENNNFRQFDATYFPVTFSKSCRIEWIGDIKKIHFYHVGIRVYESGIRVRTFQKSDLDKSSMKIAELGRIFADPGKTYPPSSAPGIEIDVPAASRKELVNITGTKAIRYLSIKIDADDIESALRKNILSIYFDDSSVPQVQSPAGDFFGAAPGLNPFTSVPFTVQTDGTMICRFIMPFKHSAIIVWDNYSDENIKVTCVIDSGDFEWEDGKTMHFRARWNIDHGLTASHFRSEDHDISDIPYLMAMGQGRVVGAAAYLYNPSNAVTSWGNWWGEGDEKIFVDSDTFPSFFGTGSEDYFNYSWSSARIFSYAYCGQPRNDGPGNRGYVSNFRWHINDDILFSEKIAFYMELGHHGVVPGFSYGRIVYFYAMPGSIDDYQQISMNDISHLPYYVWTPLAYLGSTGNKFIPAEEIIYPGSPAIIEKGKMWAEGSILKWIPRKEGERIRFRLIAKEAHIKSRIGLTLAHCPSGGTIKLFVNGEPVKIDNQEILSLMQSEQVLQNHFTQEVSINKGINEIIMESVDGDKEKMILVDFFWLREK